MTLLPDRGYKLETTSLTITKDLSLDQWQALGRRLVKLHEAAAWAIGDWLIYGRGKYGETYERAAELTGRSYESLSQYLRVAVAFPPAKRMDCPWSQHRETLRLNPESRKAVLQRAIESQWTKRQLAAHISHSLAPSQALAVTGLRVATTKQMQSSRWRKQRPKDRIRCPSCGFSFQARPRIEQPVSERGDPVGREG